jgi:thiamine-phosphate pyrophosphorylase
MPLNLQKPIIYLITSGVTTAATTPASKEYQQLTSLIEAAVAAKIHLLQIREKKLSDRTLYELSVQAAAITSGSSTHLLVNDRADIAQAAGAEGVHLTTRSIRASVIRRTFGDRILIGASTHSLNEVQEAKHSGADFAVFGPVFETESKRTYGEPLGLSALQETVATVEGAGTFPVLALGGVTLSNAADCFRAGASGVAAIRLLSNAGELSQIVQSLRASFEEAQK